MTRSKNIDLVIFWRCALCGMVWRGEERGGGGGVTVLWPVTSYWLVSQLSRSHKSLWSHWPGGHVNNVVCCFRTSLISSHENGGNRRGHLTEQSLETVDCFILRALVRCAWLGRNWAHSWGPPVTGTWRRHDRQSIRRPHTHGPTFLYENFQQYYLGEFLSENKQRKAYFCSKLTPKWLKCHVSM